MSRCDLLDDRQAEATAFDTRAQHPVKPIKNPLTLLRGDAGARIFHGKNRVIRSFADDDSDTAWRRGVSQCVIDEIVEYFCKQQRLASDCQRIVRPLKAEVDAHWQCLIHPVLCSFARERDQIAGNHPDVGGIFGVGHLQQLVDESCQARSTGYDLLQTRLDFAARGFPQGEFSLCAQSRERGLELMRGVGHKPSLCEDVGRKAVEQIVHGGHQRADLGWRSVLVDW